MKKRVVMLMMMGWGMLFASENPFELQQNMQTIEKDVTDLIGDLKREKIEDEALPEESTEAEENENTAQAVEPQKEEAVKSSEENAKEK
jgi:maltodextrin utilization protein YvdJ